MSSLVEAPSEQIRAEDDFHAWLLDPNLEAVGPPQVGREIDEKRKQRRHRTGKSENRQHHVTAQHSDDKNREKEAEQRAARN
jgi:hypothetical protein